MIRTATLADLPDLLRLALAMHDEGPVLAPVPFDPDMVGRMFSAMIGAGTLIVAAPEGALVGFIAFHVSPAPWQAEVLRGHEDALYVDPDWRRAGYAVSLVQAAEAHAGRLGARWMDAGDHSGNGTVGRLYAGLGYDRIGETYRKPLATPAGGA